MSILLTGCAGFIGMHTALRLLKQGKTLIGIDNLNAYYDIRLKKARLAKLKAFPNFEFHEMDIADKAKFEACFKQTQPQTIIHLAAQAGVRYSLTHPQTYIEANIQGFINLLELCRHYGCEHLVYASSSSVYGDSTALPFTETQKTETPISLYAATKKSNELMAHVYSHLYNIKTTGLRFFTVYGPWGRPDMAFFKFTKAMLEGKTIDVYNHGEMVRDFTYIDDIVEGVIRLTLSSDKAATPYRIFNIGNSQPIHLITYIEALEKALGLNAKKRFLPMQPGDVHATAASIDALDSAIGFKPATPIEEGIRHFVTWYRQFYATPKAQCLTE